LLHFLFSAGGLLFTLLACLRLMDYFSAIVAIINFLCIVALWFYSTTFKKKFLVGNMLIALLTAWTILVVFFANSKSWWMIKIMDEFKHAYEQANTRVFKLAVLYASFAFIISLIREVIKDMEDMEGDERYGCRTMPIKWGVPATKVFTAVWLIVLIAVLAIVQFYVLRFGWWLSAIYCLLLIIAPLIYILYKLRQARTPANYHQLSSWVKLVMFTGILSMIFFRIYS
jgi:4-hydroxybenzoate polyprenyltransferase